MRAGEVQPHLHRKDRRAPYGVKRYLLTDHLFILHRGKALKAEFYFCIGVHIPDKTPRQHTRAQIQFPMKV